MRAPRRQHATFRFYGALNDFLPPPRRQAPLYHRFQLPASVKDMFESLGVPHPEVDLILVDGTPAGFDRTVNSGDRISLYPALRSLEMGDLPRLRPPLPEHRFIVDAHLGRLARYLRVLGFDAWYRSDGEDKELARVSHQEQRILLTRDLGLLKRSEVVYGYFVRATEPRQQCAEVLGRFDLFAAAAPFARCVRCNTVLRPVDKGSVIDRLQPDTRRRHYNRFRICPACDRIFWEGSHYEHLRCFVQEALGQETQGAGDTGAMTDILEATRPSEEQD